MEPYGTKALLLGTTMATLLAGRAYKKKSLTPSGSIAAFVVGFFLFGSGLRGYNLLVFYIIAMQATKYKKHLKAKMDGTIVSHHGSTIRGTTQVLACSLFATILSIIHVIYCGKEQFIVFGNNIDKANNMTTSDFASSLSCAILAHHATCLADTLASELGILSKKQPMLITMPWKQVPSGTNGGVSILGFGWSLLGGTMIGIFTIIWDILSGITSFTDDNFIQYSRRMLLFSSICGLFGSIIDSLLGATLQTSYYDPESNLVYQEDDPRPPTATKKVIPSSLNILSNEQVNMVSVVIMTIIGGWLIGPYFF